MKAGKISYAGVGVAVGGLIGFLGVLVGWFKYSYPLGNGTATVTLSGTHDWTGTVAMAAAFGAFAFGCAYVLLQDAQLRRITGVLGAVCSAFLLIMSLAGFGRVSDADRRAGSGLHDRRRNGARDLVRRRRRRGGRFGPHLAGDPHRGSGSRSRRSGGSRRGLTTTPGTLSLHVGGDGPVTHVVDPPRTRRPGRSPVRRRS